MTPSTITLPRLALEVFWLCVMIAPVAALMAYPGVSTPVAYIIAFVIAGFGIGVLFIARRRVLAGMERTRGDLTRS